MNYKKISSLKAEKKDSIKASGDSIPNCSSQRTQRDVMIELYKKYNGEKEEIIKAYACSEEKGAVPNKEH